MRQQGDASAAASNPSQTDRDESEDEDDDDDEDQSEGRGDENAETPDSDDMDDDDSEGSHDGGDQQEGGPDAGAGLERNPAAAAVAKRTSDVQHGCTVFVRNVAFDCGEAEVRERFGEFGTVKLALLVKDRATGMPRGTAFVKVMVWGEREGAL